VTVHHDKFLLIKQTRCTNFPNLFLERNSASFGQFLCPSSKAYQRTHGNGICYTGLLTACRIRMMEPVELVYLVSFIIRNLRRDQLRRRKYGQPETSGCALQYRNTIAILRTAYFMQLLIPILYISSSVNNFLVRVL
jgi:hypothetical protein